MSKKSRIRKSQRTRIKTTPDYSLLEQKNLLAGISFQGIQVQIEGAGGNDIVEVNEVAGNQIEVTLSGFDAQRFNSNAVESIRFRGHNGNDTFTNNTDIDSFAYGHGGNDNFRGGEGNDRFQGGDGNDTLRGFGANDLLRGNAGNDVIVGGDQHDRILGGDGEDLIWGGDGRDRIHGDNGNDQIFGEDGNDKLYGFAGDDEIKGQAGNDRIEGGTGDDRLDGGDKRDLILGQDGDDFIIGGEGNDNINGGNHDDTVHGGNGNDEIFGDHGFDTLMGGNGEDEIHGGIYADIIDGGFHNDRIFGDSGGDTITGAHGNDEIDAGDGIDKFIFSRNFVGYTIVDHGSNNFTTTNTVDGRDTLKGVDVYEFDNATRTRIQFQATLNAAEVESLRLLNSTRTRRGLSPVIAISDISDYATNWSKEMSRSGFRHSDSVDRRVYLTSDRTTITENIVYVSDRSLSPTQVAARFHQLWSDSPGHFQSMINGDYDEIGVGIFLAADGWYGTHVFSNGL